jgi:hypothetical protein
MLRRSVEADDWEVEDSFEEEDDPRPYRIGGRKTTVVLWLFALLFLGLAGLRVVGADGNPVSIVALSFSPYVVVGGAVLFVISFGLRRRILACAVLLMALSMIVLLLPRFFANDPPATSGQHVRLMSAPGAADPATLVKLVRDNQVDVLTLPGITPSAVAALDTAGLSAELPHRVADLIPGGAAILSRYPLRRIIVIESDPPQPSAVVDLPTPDDLEILAIQVPSPLSSASHWRTQLDRLPFTNPARMRVLAGDFAATFDHGTFRAVLDRGYTDAAEQSGDGLIPTWTGWALPITTDHILTDHRCAILGYQVLNLPNTSHDAIFAEIALP